MMATAVNAGAYLIVGSDVIVREELGDWKGRIVAIGASVTSQPVVACTDPQGHPERTHGQQVTCSLAQLSAVPS